MCQFLSVQLYLIVASYFNILLALKSKKNDHPQGVILRSLQEYARKPLPNTILTSSHTPILQPLPKRHSSDVRKVFAILLRQFADDTETREFAQRANPVEDTD